MNSSVYGKFCHEKNTFSNNYSPTQLFLFFFILFPYKLNLKIVGAPKKQEVIQVITKDMIRKLRWILFFIHRLLVFYTFNWRKLNFQFLLTFIFQSSSGRSIRPISNITIKSFLKDSCKWYIIDITVCLLSKSVYLLTLIKYLKYIFESLIYYFRTQHVFWRKRNEKKWWSTWKARRKNYKMNPKTENNTCKPWNWNECKMKNSQI